MARKRKGLTDDVSLDVKLAQGAIVSLKVKNLRTGSVKLINFSIADLFETGDDREESVPQDESSDGEKSEVSFQSESSKFTGEPSKLGAVEDSND